MAKAKYKVKRTIHTLEMDEEKYEGIEIKARSISVGKFVELLTLAERFSKMKESAEAEESEAEFSTEDLEAIDKLFIGFSRSLVSWNLEDEDQEGVEDSAIPASLEGIRSLELDMALDIVMAWMDAIGGVDKSLGKDSISGAPSLEASLQMEASIASL